MSESSPPPAAVAPLPLGPAVAESCRLLVANAGALAKALALPLILGIGIDLVVHFLAAPGSDLLRLVLTNLAWTLLGVAWLRFLLLEDRDTLRAFPKLTRRHARFAGYALLLSLLDLPLLLGWHYLAQDPLAPQFPGLVYWLAFLFTAFVKLRLAFVFPAVAVDERYTLGLAWQHSRAIALPLFIAATLLVFLPLFALGYGISQASYENTSVLLALWAFWHVATWVLEAAYITVIAVAFRRCTGWVPAADPSVLKRFE